MNSQNCLEHQNKWQKQAEEYIIAKKYDLALELYEQALAREPNNTSYHLYSGLLLLLQGQEAEAQLTWAMALGDIEDREQELYIKELIEILDRELKRLIEFNDYQTAWIVSQHIKEIVTDNINNLLNLVQIAIQLEILDDEIYHLLELINELLPIKTNDCDTNLLADVIQKLLTCMTKYTIETELFISVINFIEVCLKAFSDDSVKIIIDTIMVQCIKISSFDKRTDIAIQCGELCLERVHENMYIQHREILTTLAHFYQNAREYEKGIELSKLCYKISRTLAEKICANYVVIRGLMTSGSYWQEAYNRLQDQINLIEKLIETKPDDINIVNICRLFSSLFSLPYFDDQPERNHIIQHKISSFCQSQIIKNYAEVAENKQKYLHLRRNNIDNKKNVLNIGYISHCFKRHSVSWLCRWLFQYHDSERFRIHCYFYHDSDKLENFTQNYFASKSYKFYTFGIYENDRGWNQIQSDEIDILVDLDSLTLDGSCELMSMKSAPIQVTWLGWDSSGIPSIDYFIADPYVLPESAQDYYSETIWRLPQTYIAVDGFEIDVPDLRREDLDIPSDAIIYFMTQRGYKRHQPHLHLQMKIIKEVPNSYLLIKGDADPEATEIFFEKIAAEEGVDFDRIKFLPYARSEAIHRANLQIADIVLDTYPYNGATTTLETLWMGIPLLTRVGEQFSARNSYSMMVNAGITEGIAWTEEEYVEWGVRLGKDEKLRQQISWKLRQSRHTAPLWNAKQFTRDMETAYEQMWQKYLDSK